MSCGAGHDHTPEATAVPAAEEVKRPPHLEARASSPAGDAERRRRHVGGCRHVVSSRRGPSDAQLLCARLERGALETQADGGSARTSEHPAALVQRARSNRLGSSAVKAPPAGEPSTGTNMCSLIRSLPANSIAHMSNAFRSAS